MIKLAQTFDLIRLSYERGNLFSLICKVMNGMLFVVLVILISVDLIKWSLFIDLTCLNRYDLVHLMTLLVENFV